MSIYIKDMEMPQFFDRLFVGRSFDGNIYIRNEREDEKSDSVTWYPVIEIPPHGRLIDADAFAVHKFVDAEHDISISDGGACYRRGWDDAIEAIMVNAETIIGEK